MIQTFSSFFFFYCFFYCVVAGSRAICESDAAVPKPRQTRWIYIELRRPQCHHEFFIFYGSWWIIKIIKTGAIIFVIIVWLCEWLLFGEGELDKMLILCG